MTEERCLNCDETVTGNYCQHCGQPVKTPRGPVFNALMTFLDEFNLDHKFFTSLKSLFIAPGALTKLFADGKRYSMLPPFRMYLVISILFLLIYEIPTPNVNNSNFYVSGELIGRDEPDPELGNFQLFMEDGIIEKWAPDKAVELKERDPQELMQDMVSRINKYSSQVLILFIPILALVMKILLSKRYLYFDHLIFALHFQSWLLLMIIIVNSMIYFSKYFYLLLLTIPIYLYLSLRRVYETRWYMTIFNLLLIMVGYFSTIYVTVLGSVIFLVYTS